MSKFDEQLSKFQLPSVEEGIRFLTIFKDEKMPAVADSIKIVKVDEESKPEATTIKKITASPQVQGKIATKALELKHALNEFKEIVSETKYLSPKIGVRTSDGYFTITDHQADHVHITIAAKTLEKAIEVFADRVYENSQACTTKTSKFNYEMRCAKVSTKYKHNVISFEER